MGTTASFRLALEKLISEHSRENVSNTPDFILAEFMLASLTAFETAMIERTNWYGPGTQMGVGGPPNVAIDTGWIKTGESDIGEYAPRPRSGPSDPPQMSPQDEIEMLVKREVRKALIQLGFTVP